ncbi:MAG: N-acetyl-alpha-D-glucosaminyl L-malate synthase BshA [Planctomycetota bacterium]
MKIAIACYPTYGGSGVVATELGLALAERDHEIHFLSYQPPQRLGEGVYRPGVHYHEVQVTAYPLFRYPPYDLALASKLVEVVEAYDVDIIHAHYAIPHAVSAVLARDMLGNGVKVLTTLHGTDVTLVGQDPSYLPATRYGLQRSDMVTAVSAHLRSETHRLLCEDCDIRVIHNFVNTDRYRPRPCDKTRALYAEEDERILLHVSNFRPVKRVEDVVRIFARVAERVPAKLVMVGDGPERPRAEALAAELGLSDRVAFLGQQGAIEELMNCADLFVLPSESESFGLAALEAMACGVPPVASRLGGLPEVVEDGVSGLLEPRDQLDRLADRATELLLDRDAYRSMAEAARVRAVECFGRSLGIAAYESAYRELLVS